ncbi:T9SS type A sorting domain-containing protein [Labilibacter marinus]|uniref:T9SS type A sorting domain-containing protein n=1 Tax=Labilibacter marinus TaxID=1477105 RepID=UPI00082E7E9A|nr:T9SS type A sorting domain-containing protein [Labilibacter marinus]
MKKKLLKFSVLVILMITCSFSNAQNLYWSGDQADVYYASFEQNAVLWFTNPTTVGLDVESSTEAFVHGQRSAKFFTDDLATTSAATSGNSTVILGGTNGYVDGNINNIEAGVYTFSAKIYIVENPPTNLLVYFQESNAGVAGAGSTLLSIPLAEVTVGGSPITQGGWQDIQGVVSLPDYTAMKTGVRTRPQDYPDATGASAMYVDNMVLELGNTTDLKLETSVEMDVYPNPTTNVVNIKTPFGSKVELCNVAGMVVKTFVSSSDVEKVDVSQLNKGLYVVKVSNKGTIKTQKLLVK